VLIGNPLCTTIHSVSFDLIISIFFQVALRCLAQLSGSTNICELFVSLVKRFDLEDSQLESDSQECKTDEPDRKDEESTVIAEELNNRRFAVSFHSSRILVFHAINLFLLRKGAHKLLDE
jgi:hypothetical protein